MKTLLLQIWTPNGWQEVDRDDFAPDDVFRHPWMTSATARVMRLINHDGYPSMYRLGCVMPHGIDFILYDDKHHVRDRYTE